MANAFDQFDSQDFGSPGSTATDRAEGIYKSSDISVKDPATGKPSTSLAASNSNAFDDTSTPEANPFDKFEANPFDQFDNSAKGSWKKSFKDTGRDFGAAADVILGLPGFVATALSKAIGSGIAAVAGEEHPFTTASNIVNEAAKNPVTSFLTHPIQSLTGYDASKSIVSDVFGALDNKIQQGGKVVGDAAGQQDLGEGFSQAVQLAMVGLGAKGMKEAGNLTPKESLKESDILASLDKEIPKEQPKNSVNPVSESLSPEQQAAIDTQTKGMSLEDTKSPVDHGRIDEFDNSKTPVKTDAIPDEGVAYSNVTDKASNIPSLEDLPKAPTPKEISNLIEYEKVDPNSLKTQQRELDLADNNGINYKDHATPEQGVAHIATLLNDLTVKIKGEPGQFDLPGINEKPNLGGVGKKGFGQGGAVNFADMFGSKEEAAKYLSSLEKDTGAKATENNASGESAASVEAINRLKQQNAAGIRHYQIDPRTNEIIPLTSADRVDAQAPEGKAIVQQDANGKVTILDNKSDFKSEGLINRSEFQLNKKLGGTGKKGFGQGGAVSFLGKAKERTPEQKAKEMNAQEFAQDFMARHPQYADRPEVAAQVYQRLNNPVDAAPTLREAIEQSGFLKSVDKGLGAVSTRVANISKPIVHKMITYEKDLLKQTHINTDKAVPFLTSLNKLPKNTKALVDNLLLNNHTEGLNRVFDSINRPDMKEAYIKVRDMLDHVGNQLLDVGRVEKLRTDYFPRVVTDIEGLKNTLGSVEKTNLEVKLNEARQKAASNGTSFGPLDESKIVNSFLRSRTSQGGKPGFSKNRKIDEVAPDLEKFYASPTEALHTYVRNAVSEVETAKFFGRDAIKEEGGKLNIDKSIGELVAREIRDGKISGKQAIELDSILKSRHGPGNQTSNRYLQDMKNISNMGLLGDFVSTISQGQDLFLATYLNGFRATGMAMVDMAAGRSKVNMKDFGLIDHVSEEFVSSRTSAKALQKVFKYSFFTGMDSIGKTVVLNGALKNATNKLASETGEAKFRSKWEPRFGSDYPQLVKDLKAGESTELTDTLAFSQLSKLQPVTKIEMPQKYLDMPNGRVIYMLKSFMLKQFDLARNDIYNELKEGNIKDGMANFARLTLLLGFGGAAADAIRDAMLYGFKNITFKTSDVADQVLKNFGLNTFVLNKVKAGKLGEALTSMIVPPLTMFDPVFQDMKAELDGDPDTESSHKSWKFIPLVGKTLYSRYGGGKEKELDKRDRQNQ